MLRVPARYNTTIDTAAATTARGTVRRASTISSAIGRTALDAAKGKGEGGPEIMSFSDTDGTEKTTAERRGRTEAL
jgi:hypothetical protein